MELKDVRTGMFVSWIENKKTVTAIVKSVFFESYNFEFATAAYIVRQKDAGKVEREQEEIEVDDGFKVHTDVASVIPNLKALDLERYPHCMHTMYPVNENTFICKDEMYENACDKLKTLRYATFDEVNALVTAKGLGNLVYKPFAFRYEKQTEYKHQAGTNIREDTYLHVIEDTQLLEEKADGVANINGAFYAVNVDSYLKNGVIKYQ